MQPSKAIMYRVGAGKALGLAVGLAAFFLLPLFISEPSIMLRSALLLWYPTLGALVGLYGVFSYHPVMNFPLPWWFRGAIIGGWMNFMLTLFTQEQLCTTVIGVFGEYSPFLSPYWMVLEGAAVCVLFDYLLTRWFGEGWANKIDS